MRWFRRPRPPAILIVIVAWIAYALLFRFINLGQVYLLLFRAWPVAALLLAAGAGLHLFRPGWPSRVLIVVGSVWLGVLAVSIVAGYILLFFLWR
jgi:hypothetical protein